MIHLQVLTPYFNFQKAVNWIIFAALKLTN
jgi:hypothetical protein